MTPFDLSGASHTDYYQSDQVGLTDPAQQWMLGKQQEASAKLRGPILAAAARLGLASHRAVELDELIQKTRTQIINAPNWVGPEEIRSLEQRIFQWEEQLNRERRDLWRDLQPLVEAARDAGIEANRRMFLREILDGNLPESTS
jgi:hypothetical protein